VTPTTTDAARDTEAEATVLHLARWTVTSGSNVQSRGAVVLAAGDHQWEASVEGNGPIDALFRAVDAAIAEVLTGHPRLLAYDIHALAEGPDAEGEVRVRIAPPEAASGARSSGKYVGTARSTNIVAASIEAYIQAINEMLAESHWAGATEAAGNRKRSRTVAAAKARRAELDPDEAKRASIPWTD
jgi:hypothetical protein